MEDFLKAFSDEKFVMLISCIISAYIAMVAIMLTRIRGRVYRKNSDKEKAYELLLKGYEQKTLNDKAISLIYKREIARKYDNLSYISFLESFLIYVRQKDEDGELTTHISKIIDPILEKEKAEKPYSNIKERERRILLAIEESAQKGELTSLNNNLEDLSIVIESNQKTLDKARMTNKWSIPISVIGILLTLFIWLYGSSLSEKDIQRISTQIYTSVADSLYVITSDSVITNK